MCQAWVPLVFLSARHRQMWASHAWLSLAPSLLSWLVLPLPDTRRFWSINHKPRHTAVTSTLLDGPPIYFFYLFIFFFCKRAQAIRDRTVPNCSSRLCSSSLFTQDISSLWSSCLKRRKPSALDTRENNACLIHVCGTCLDRLSGWFFYI